MKKKGKFIRSYHGQERTECPITVLFHSSLLVIDGEHSGGCDWANALRRRVGVKMASLVHLTYLPPLPSSSFSKQLWRRFQATT